VTCCPDRPTDRAGPGERDLIFSHEKGSRIGIGGFGLGGMMRMKEEKGEKKGTTCSTDPLETTDTALCHNISPPG